VEGVAEIKRIEGMGLAVAAECGCGCGRWAVACIALGCDAYEGVCVFTKGMSMTSIIHHLLAG